LTTSELGRVAEIAAAIEDRFAGTERDPVPHHLIEMQRALYPIVAVEAAVSPRRCNLSST
jgi:hypothetical protein